MIALTWYGQKIIRASWLMETRESLRSQIMLINPAILIHFDEGRFNDIDSLCKKLGQSSGTRFTVILPDGKVVGDTRENPVEMDNHLYRPEIQEALKSGSGVASRYSNTIFQTMMYLAITIERDGQEIGVTRAAISIDSIDEAIKLVRIRMAVAVFIIAVLMAAVGLYFSRRISRPIEELRSGAEKFARGNLASRIHVHGSVETESLAATLNEMAANLDERIKTITRQRNEREAILTSMVEGVLAVDSEEHIISMNDAAAGLTGVDISRAVGKSVQEVIRNHDLHQAVHDALANPQPVEREIYFPGASEKYLQAHGATLRDAQGNIIGALIVLNDVTRLRRLETMRRDFVANVSHELRTPITTIQGFVETLLDGSLKNPEEAERFLKIIIRQVDRLNALIADLLSLSRIEEEAERAEISRTLPPLRPVLLECMEACEIKARDKKMSLTLDCDEGLAASVNVPLFEQAVINLIDNAIKFSEPESKVEISAQNEENNIVIRIRDHGCGIEKEHLARIFERFYRVDKGRSRSLGGTGLGLAIVKHIVLAHSGTVKVDSTVGKGTTFSIVLPRN